MCGRYQPGSPLNLLPSHLRTHLESGEDELAVLVAREQPVAGREQDGDGVVVLDETCTARGGHQPQHHPSFHLSIDEPRRGWPDVGTRYWCGAAQSV